MTYATGMTPKELIASGKSGFYSKPHGLWFADGDSLPPLPEPMLAIAELAPAPKPDAKSAKAKTADSTTPSTEG